MGELRSLAAPARPLRLGGMPSQSPFEGGCRGTKCWPFFCSISRRQASFIRPASCRPPLKKRPSVRQCSFVKQTSHSRDFLGFRMKRNAFFEELAPSKRLRAAGGFEALPDGVLGTVVDFLVPVAERDDQFCQRRRMAERMFEALAYNHEFMPLARDALALLGSCRLLRYGPLFARTAVFHHMLHQNFLELCFEKLAEGCRLPQHELRALQITVERMSPAQARRHALEQALLRLAVRCTTARYRCNRHLARGAGLDRLTGRPLPSKLEDVEDEGKVKRLLV